MAQSSRVRGDMFIDMSHVDECQLLELKAPYIIKYMRYHYKNGQKIIVNRKKFGVKVVPDQIEVQFRFLELNSNGYKLSLVIKR